MKSLQKHFLQGRVVLLTLNSERSLKTETIRRGHYQSQARSLHSVSSENYGLSRAQYRRFSKQSSSGTQKGKNFYIFIYFYINSAMLVCLFTSRNIFAE